MIHQDSRIRFMRLLVFFDLPVETAAQRRDYRLFRKALIKDGYIMVQKSVYSKLVVNEHVVESALSRLREIAPPKGIVQVLKVTERQYSSMETVTGTPLQHDEIDVRDEVIVL